ncbi:MAG: FGGY family carbohydrate kinase [Bacteroidota bacterium]|nr:FGGY family carbohydrate kinase [Bacteroidota bacterium]
MKRIPVIAIFDIGKTNKKLLLFDETYKLVYEESKQLPETKDEDGFPCEDVYILAQWIKDTFHTIIKDERFNIKAVNFSAYGASFVYLDESLNIILSLYNYLKPFPAQLKEKFYNTYGGEENFARTTASPVLGNLNSGMQLYRLKYEKPEAFAKIKYALHLPQFVSFVLTGISGSEITSIGCHTNLWDFQKNKYHSWVTEEGVADKFPEAINVEKIVAKINKTIPAGIGLHDSSAALIPYLIAFSEPFILLSTGTWCISLNPFNNSPLTESELQQDCLSFLSYKGKPVKASRLFAGYEHEQQVKKLAEHFGTHPDYYKQVKFDSKFLKRNLYNDSVSDHADKSSLAQSEFSVRNPHSFKSYEEAYHQLMEDLMVQQYRSTNLVLKRTHCKRIFVDGGFSNNPIYMNLLARAFPQMEVYAATVPQASALGAALVIHQHWNSKPLPSDIIELKYYTTKQETF